MIMLIQFYCFIINKRYKIINVFNVLRIKDERSLLVLDKHELHLHYAIPSPMELREMVFVCHQVIIKRSLCNVHICNDWIK